uniref:C2H2-type domain-containing protein n=1 Tax=Anopheles gambiae TaxID=7165 RepID=A0A1S4H8F2_ANOGA
MSTEALETAARNDAGRDTRCRLCLKQIEIAQTAGIDLLENQDINRLLLDVYRVEVLQTDEGPTMICVPCYVQLVHHYKLRIRCLSLRKNFRLNQSVLLAQINAFRAIAGEARIASINELAESAPQCSNGTAVQERGTQTDVVSLPSPAKSSAPEPNTALVGMPNRPEPNAEPAVEKQSATIVIDDESREGSVVTVQSEVMADLMNAAENQATVEAQLATEDSVPTVRSVLTAESGSATAVESAPAAESEPTDEVVTAAEVESVPHAATPPKEGSAQRMRIQQLIPVLVDCLKVPHYLEALWPVKATIDRDEPAPLVYMCRTCNKTFKSKDSLEHHQKRADCVPTCRYCKTVWSAEHNCTFIKKYSYLMPHILGNDKYCTKYEDTGTALLLQPAGDGASGSTNGTETPPKGSPTVNGPSVVNGGAGSKKTKRDKNGKKIRTPSTSDRRSHTPSLKSAAKRRDSRNRKLSNGSLEAAKPEREKSGDQAQTSICLSSSDEDELAISFARRASGHSIKRRRISSRED